MSNFGGKNEENWRRTSRREAFEDMKEQFVTQKYND